MFSLVAFVAMMVAPAMAASIPYCPGDFTYIRYLTDAELKKAYTAGAIAQLGSVASAEGSFDPLALGSNVLTSTELDLDLDEDIVVLAATVLAANADPKGFVSVINTYTGQVVDCKYLLQKDYFRVSGKACYYKVDESIIEFCQEAKSEFAINAFAAGKGAIVTAASSVQVIGFSATSIDIAAVGSQGLSTTVQATDTVTGKTGTNSAQSLLNVFQQGNSKLNATVDNVVTDTSSSSSVKISAKSTGK